MGNEITIDGKKVIELHENYAVLYLPEEAVEIDLMVQVYHGGKIIAVERTLSLEDIREAFKRAEDDYIAPDCIWRLKGPYGEKENNELS